MPIWSLLPGPERSVPAPDQKSKLCSGCDHDYVGPAFRRLDAQSATRQVHGSRIVQPVTSAEQGRVVYRYKRPFRDGSTHVVLEPLDFIARLAAALTNHCLAVNEELASATLFRADGVCDSEFVPRDRLKTLSSASRSP